MEPLKLKRQSKDLANVDVEEESALGLWRLTSGDTVGAAEPEAQNHLHHCSPCSHVGEDSFSKDMSWSEQDSSAAMGSVQSAFSSFEARRSFSKLRQELVHRHRMIEAVSRKHRRALTGRAARPGADEVAPPRARSQAGTAKKVSQEPRQRGSSPKKMQLHDALPKQERLKGWKKRNPSSLPSKASQVETLNQKAMHESVGDPLSSSRSRSVEIPDLELHPPAIEDRWENVKFSAMTSARPNLEAIMVQRSLRKQMIRSLRLQPVAEVEELYDLLKDPQAWTSTSPRLPLQGWGFDPEAAPVPTGVPPLHRPARRFQRPIKKSERPATVASSTFHLPSDLEEAVWNVMDLSS